MVEYVNIFGQPVSTDAAPRRPKAAPKAATEDRGFHRGWRVEGHKPGALESAKAAADADCKQWADMSDQARAQAERMGARAPTPWDEARWRSSARKQLVGVKHVPDAAKQLRDMAERAGWLDVTVTEDKREPARPASSTL